MTFPGDYTKYQNVTIDNTKVDATLTDFPVFLDLSEFDTTTDIFDTCRSDGGDIRITLSDGTTQLAREVVSIDTTAKTGEVHVKIPSLASASDTTIRVWYNGTDTEPAEDSTYGKENTWNSNYEIVQHMNQDPSGSAPQMIDSTSNDYDGTSNGTMTSGDLVAAKIGDGLDFDGSDDYINCPASDTGFLGALTISCWAKIDSGSAYRHFAGKHASGGGTANPFDFRTNNAATPLMELIRANTGYKEYSGPAVVLNTMTHYAATAPNIIQTAPEFYVDGSATTGTSIGGFGSGAPTGSTADIKIGRRADGVVKMDGVIDEMRILSTELSADWISTEYNNQSSPSTFYSVSDEQTTGGSTILPINMLQKLFSQQNGDL